MTGSPWPLRKLDEVCEVVLGQSPPGSSYNTEVEGVPFFQGKAEFGEWHPTVRKWTTAPKKRAKEGDVLISVRAPVGPTNIAPVDCAIGRGLAALRPHDGLLPKYLIYALRATQQALVDEGTGTTFEAITGAKLRAHEIHVAPLDEQRRIVEAIETHLSHLDAGVESLQRAKRNLERMRAAMLRDGASGRLIGLAAETDRGTPAHWSYALIGEECEVVGGIQKQPKRAPRDNPYPYLRVANVLRDRLDLAEVKEFEVFEGELERYRLRPGDLLVVEGNGSASQIGRSAMWRGEIEYCVHQNHIIRVRPSPRLNPEFLNLYWNSPDTADRLMAVASSTSGLYTLSAGKVRAVEVPVPSLEEQEAIVTRAAQLTSLIDRLDFSLSTTSARAAALRRRVLAAAFSGDLTGSGEGVAA